MYPFFWLASHKFLRGLLSEVGDFTTSKNTWHAIATLSAFASLPCAATECPSAFQFLHPGVAIFTGIRIDRDFDFDFVTASDCCCLWLNKLTKNQSIASKDQHVEHLSNEMHARQLRTECCSFKLR
ncbi:hypothetical protein C8R43DRAFT_563083 [Mycena crocata]|nr:hypothetical protein C8R43DRAFT_563083 [Mycena crocata]